MGEVLVRRDRPRAVGGAVVFVDVDEVDVRRHVQLARAELAHAQHPEGEVAALRRLRRAVDLVELGAGGREGAVQRHFGQVGHGPGDVVHRGAVLHVEHRQPLQHQVAGHAQAAGQGAGREQGVDQRGDGGLVGQAGGQQGQLGRIAAAHPLHIAAVFSKNGKRLAHDPVLDCLPAGSPRAPRHRV